MAGDSETLFSSWRGFRLSWLSNPNPSSTQLLGQSFLCQIAGLWKGHENDGINWSWMVVIWETKAPWDSSFLEITAVFTLPGDSKKNEQMIGQHSDWHLCHHRFLQDALILPHCRTASGGSCWSHRDPYTPCLGLVSLLLTWERFRVFLFLKWMMHLANVIDRGGFKWD